ncbi:MAG: hypothetical protein QM733_21785 [Ilumatobacteraceae bacterium]
MWRPASARSWVTTSSAEQVVRSSSSALSASSASSALVGSSASVSTGSWTVAASVVARWSIPPDHWCGRWRQRWAGSGMPILARPCATPSRGTRSPWAFHASSTWWPTRRSGSNAANGSWATKPIERPLSAWRCRADIVSRFSPSTAIRPVTTADAGSSPMIARSSVVLPEPDAPTTASWPPCSTVSEIPASARCPLA